MPAADSRRQESLTAVVLFTDFTPGWIGFSGADGTLIEQRQTDEQDTNVGELAAIELAVQWLGDRAGVILTDSASAVRVIAGGRPHPRALRPELQLQAGKRIRSSLNGVVAWIPRSLNVADAAVGAGSQSAATQ